MSFEDMSFECLEMIMCLPKGMRMFADSIDLGFFEHIFV